MGCAIFIAYSETFCTIVCNESTLQSDFPLSQCGVPSKYFFVFSNLDICFHSMVINTSINRAVIRLPGTSSLRWSKNKGHHNYHNNSSDNPSHNNQTQIDTGTAYCIVTRSQQEKEWYSTEGMYYVYKGKQIVSTYVKLNIIVIFIVFELFVLKK